MPNFGEFACGDSTLQEITLTEYLLGFIGPDFQLQPSFNDSHIDLQGDVRVVFVLLASYSLACIVVLLLKRFSEQKKAR